ncbi:hypothetical protein [Mesorhizobium sp. LCM 4576]|uniref:hypothetical protein n=1 Tax=Mesorhizobium sp. LCM 4576 TaxID=1848289 RepID=UPI001FCD8697|nr:hypothetical protein [Mesorhizobium sp. LCM 4576]
MKKFEFVNEAAKKAFQELPKDIKKQFGADLQAVQNGERPFSERTNIKEGVGPSAIELIENGSPAIERFTVQNTRTRFSFCMPSPRQLMALTGRR